MTEEIGTQKELCTSISITAFHSFSAADCISDKPFTAFYTLHNVSMWQIPCPSLAFFAGDGSSPCTAFGTLNPSPSPVSSSICQHKPFYQPTSVPGGIQTKPSIKGRQIVALSSGGTEVLGKEQGRKKQQKPSTTNNINNNKALLWKFSKWSLGYHVKAVTKFINLSGKLATLCMDL